MGSRVHKVIGYGLTDVKHKNGDVKDPRINMDHIRALWYPEDQDVEAVKAALRPILYVYWC